MLSKRNIKTIKVEMKNWNWSFWNLNLQSSLIFSRYLELVHPIWHKTNFKIRWIYISFVVNWIFGSSLCAHLVATSKVKHSILLQYEWKRYVKFCDLYVVLHYRLFPIALRSWMCEIPQFPQHVLMTREQQCLWASPLTLWSTHKCDL